MTDPTTRIAGLSPKKRALLRARLKERREQPAGGADAIPVQPRPSGPDGLRFPVSFSQLREWILDRLDPGTAAYNIPLALELNRRIELPVLAGAVAELVARHEALRTGIRMPAAGEGPGEANEPEQVVLPRLRPPLPVVDLTGVPRADGLRTARRLETLHAALPFRLDRAPLFRVALVRLGDRDDRLLLSMHHIISDGWSMSVLARDLGELYRARAAGEEPRLPALSVQYGDFAAWQRRTLRDEVLDRLVDFWRDELSGAPPAVELPTDRPRSATKDRPAASLDLAIPGPLADALRRVAREGDASLFMVLLAALDVVVARASGARDLSVGTFIANRNRSETRDLIGFFVNTLVLRTRLDGDPSLHRVLERARQTCLAAYAHQDLPFEKLLDALQPRRDPGRTPLFQVLCVLQNLPRTQVAEEELALRNNVVSVRKAPFELSAYFFEAGEGIAGTLEYDRWLFDPTTVRRWRKALFAVLEEFAERPEAPLSKVVLLDRAERHQVCREWGEAPAGAPAGAWTVVDLWAAQAERIPDTVAIETLDGQAVSHGALARRAEALARRLRDLGAGPGGVVGVWSAGGPEGIAALLGVLRAGAAYLPLDPDHPPERLRFLIADAGVGAVVVAGAAGRGVRPGPTVTGGAIPIVDLEEVPAAVPGAGGRAAVPSRRPDPASLAYVLYTSGSTGRPKGVEVSHDSLARYVRIAAAGYRLAPGDRVLQFASLSFDASAEEVYPSLVTGTPLVCRDPAAPPSPLELLEVAARRRLTVLDLPTAYWHGLVSALGPAPGPAPGQAPRQAPELPPDLRLVVLGGEAARAEAVDGWQDRAGSTVRLVNTYGPTEATIVCSWTDLAGRPPGAVVPIGRPIPGSRIVLADRSLQPALHGSPGEIVIGGGLARGYRGRPGLTAERFVPDPWSGLPGERLYRSGDLARCGPTGELEFAGRFDDQVKVRGYRIEPGEVEAALARLPGVAAVAVAAREDTAGAGRRLVAYVVGAGGSQPPPAPELRRLAAERLPPHMVPALFVPLPELPLTDRGKVDRGRLPAPGAARDGSGVPYAAPRSPTERAVAAVWCEVLGLERTGIHDNFFDLGGDSLVLLQVHERLVSELPAAASLTVLDLFRHPTIEALAARLEPGDGGRRGGGAVRDRAARQREARAARRPVRRPRHGGRGGRGAG